MKVPSTDILVILLLFVFYFCPPKLSIAGQYKAVILQHDRECFENFSIMDQVMSRAMNQPELKWSSRVTNVKLENRQPLPQCRSGYLYPFVKALNEKNIQAVVGAVADHVCEAAATLASVHGKLYVSWSCTASSLSDKILYPTFARTVPSAAATARALATFVAELRWKYSVLLVANDETWRRLAEKLDAAIRYQGFVVRDFIILDIRASVEEIENLMLTIRAPVKAIILSMDLTMSLLRNVLTAAAELGWADGRFAFFVLHVMTTLHPTSIPTLSTSSLDILRALFVVTVVATNVTYEEVWESHENEAVFQEILNGTSTDEVYNFYRQYSSLSLFLTALRRSHQEAGGANLSLYTRNAVFPTLLGHGETDEVGDLVVKFVLLDFWPSARVFRTAAELNVDQREDLYVTDNHWKNSIDWPTGQPLIADPDCVIQDFDCSESIDDTALNTEETVGVIVALLICVAGALGITAFVRKKLIFKEMRRKVLLTVDDIVLTQPSKKIIHDGSTFDKPDILKASHDSLRPHTHMSTGKSDRPTGTGQLSSGRLNGDMVHLKHFITATTFEVKTKAMNQLLQMYELRHENINPFLGCMADPQEPVLVWEHCSRGSLANVLENEDIKLDWSFKLSLLTDLVRGMRYLHSCPVKHHGNLTSRNCVIDSRWVLKITDYGLPLFFETQNLSSPLLTAKDKLWAAPELLRDETLLKRGTQVGDVYSFSIIMQEVVVRGQPYSMLQLSAEELIEKLKCPPPLIRPSVSKQAAPPEAINIMRQCWAEYPDMRPDFGEINEQFKRLNQGKKVNIVDTMFQMLEKYSNNLEDLIKERTIQLDEEKKKTDQLLNRMLPSTVAENLKAGLPVEPEKFEEVTIYFSDIVGFTTISAYSEPMEIVDLLNDLYTAFDNTIDNYNVYKVETIGDAYMVVGGLPEVIPNHAEEIATMALDLLHVCGKFKIRHMPTVPLMLRIGLHTGPVVAGVVGLTMPRYCLFGDTVNTASRMESSGLAYRIHISKTTEQKLRSAGGYTIQHRGEITLKGRGKQPTFWLCGKTGFEKEVPVPPEVDGEDNHGFKNDDVFKAMGRKKVGGSETNASENQDDETPKVHNSTAQDFNVGELASGLLKLTPILADIERNIQTPLDYDNIFLSPPITSTYENKCFNKQNSRTFPFGPKPIKNTSQHIQRIKENELNVSSITTCSRRSSSASLMSIISRIETAPPESHVAETL
ncbi:retinal guanylyl cyclase 2-like isoform X2 [Limulus polyphemus]|uniref:Guanylate cyclase n=1 Tax=Limulus polyphemus TaxID=6850 RepID=A0ABM1SRI1_LIMPO|nr:retinal guanylyl cyclase 2-like isoform X2 [Limulus polyphemus]